MLTREEILSGYKKVDFPEKLFDESIKDVKNIIFFEESTQPLSQKEKDTKKLSQSYVLPWRLVQKNFGDTNNNKNNTFSRGGNFAPKEPLIEIHIDNFKNIYDKYSIPNNIGIIYFKNNYGGINGPYNLDQIKNLYKNKKLDSTYEFRPIDIFSFKDADLYSFQSVKIINDDKWIDSINDSPLLKYNELFKNKKDKNIPKQTKIEENKPQEDKKEDIVSKDEIKEKKKKDVKLKEEKKEDKPEDKKEDKKADKKEDKKDNHTKESDGKWEVVGKKKKNKEKEEAENNQIIGLKTKESKENKKGKKKKKQFEDTNFELGFQVK